VVAATTRSASFRRLELSAQSFWRVVVPSCRRQDDRDARCDVSALRAKGVAEAGRALQVAVRCWVGNWRRCCQIGTLSSDTHAWQRLT